jgi:hypothetical protein
MIGRLLSLGLIEVDKFTLTKEALELVDKEFAQVKTPPFFVDRKRWKLSFSSRLMRKYVKQNLVLNNHINN